MLKLIILRLDKQKTSQKIVLFFLKLSFLTFNYKFLITCHMKRRVRE
ncbi:hypothetical protein J2W57_000957 [Chryseobacterium ginsenosidimutans]|uniref:Uncharacterized protein n=1 Tax=Chryseobacterium geocarposphaerae TaxID=1416776 RepID=A0ABU1LFE5_9FLAO|nr:hypothetical protein [Chryseobacterium geocarposphaerae]MDR6697597.1 hypothetical protein [Chryseobacterium ginsenosidimutans]